MRASQLLFSCLVVLFLIPTTGKTQKPDKAGSKDHPLISRYEGFHISGYQDTEFDRYILPLGPGKDRVLTDSKTLEGRVIKISYQNTAEQRPSLFQLVRNFELAFESKNAELVYSCDAAECGKSSDDLFVITAEANRFLNGFMRFGEHAYRVYQFGSDGKNYYAALFFRGEKNQMLYELHVIELEEMATDKVTIANIGESIENAGKMAFYGILFDFGKSSLQADSYEEVRLIAEYLREHSDEQFYLVGHTDNVGQYQTNLSLSEARAETVIGVLTNQYRIPDSQISAVGVGPVAPVASNASDSGRAQNRRVELVKR